MMSWATLTERLLRIDKSPMSKFIEQKKIKMILTLIKIAKIDERV